MKILQLSTSDLGGGAERVAWTLFDAYRQQGHDSWLVVGRKKSDDPDVLPIPSETLKPPSWARLCWTLHGRLSPLENRLRGIAQLRYWLRLMAQNQAGRDRELGRENFNFPASRKLLSLLPCKPDIVHAHNLHGDYFDLRYLAALSQQLPVVLTLHDQWLLTGHCAYTLGCERWRQGCGQCPDLTIYPALQRDGTAGNWRRKKQIYQRSQIYVGTPNRWLADSVTQSMLKSHETRIIPYGVDLSIYQPTGQTTARQTLGLDTTAFIILFAAHGIKTNRFKDYATVEQAVRQVAERQNSERPFLFLALGGHEETVEPLGAGHIRHIPFQSDPRQVARYYQAADVFLHAAHADNFPNTVLESLACGTPVIATAVGGIPEQIEDGITGYLVPPQDSQAMAARITQLQVDDDLRQRLGRQAAETARRRFDLNRQVDDYLNWYQEIIANALPNIN